MGIRCRYDVYVEIVFKIVIRFAMNYTGISRSFEDYEVTCLPKILVYDLKTDRIVRRYYADSFLRKFLVYLDLFGFL